jgi:hypothetical protein
VPKQFFNVVVLGRSLGALLLAALLGRRGMRVLVLGDGAKEPSYQVLDTALLRRNFRLYTSPLPSFNRFLLEMAQQQSFRRRLVVSEPMFQVLESRVMRLSLSADAEVFRAGLARAFKDDAQTSVESLYEELGVVNATCDRLFESMAAFEASTSWGRAKSAIDREPEALPLAGLSAESFLESLPVSYRNLVNESASFWSHLADPLPLLATARIHGTWTRAPLSLPGGEDAIIEFLSERIRSSGGDVRLGKRVTSVAVKGNHVVSVQIEGEEDSTGLDHIVTTQRFRDVLRRTSGFAPRPSELERFPELSAKAGRFLVSCTLSKGALPRALAHDALLLGELPVWVSRHAPPKLKSPSKTESSVPGELVTLEARVPFAQIPFARARVLEAFEREFPFAKEGYRVVDSAHDGYPVWSYEAGKRQLHERMDFRAHGVSVEPEPMDPIWSRSAEASLLADPITTPLANVYLCGPSVLPALGQEGELIAAWSVAQTIERQTPQKNQFRRGLLGKLGL